MVQQVLYVAATGQIIDWQDTAAFGYPPDPAGTATLPVSAAEWATQATPQHVAAGALAPGAITPPLTLAQQAQAALALGLVITSTATPALDGTYACDDAAQAKLNRMWGLIQRAGGAAFPGGLSALPWVDTSGAAHSFTRVSDFLNLETAIGDYVLALDLVIATGTGTLPPATATIA